MPSMAFADAAVTDNPDVNTIAFTSDAHNMLSSNNSGLRLAQWINDACLSENDKLDIMCGLGDYGNYQSYAWDYWEETNNIINAINNSDNVIYDGIFIAGNHDWLNGIMRLSDTKKIEKSTGRVFSGSNYEIYCFGATSTFEVFDNDDITKLRTYLEGVDSSKTIFIISHYPLHKTSERSMTNASKVVKAINDNADGKQIVFLWGHNHSDVGSSETNYDKIITDSIDSYGGDIGIKFIYAAAGCMSDSDYSAGSGSGKIKGKGLVTCLNKNGELSLKYYDKEGKSLADTTFHDIHQYEAKEPTCDEVGWDAYEACSKCDYTTYKEIPANGHDWKHIVKAAQLLKNGEEYDICDTCKSVENKKTLYGWSNSYLKGLKVKKGKKSFTVKWKKQSKKVRKNFTGYQIRYSTNSDMSGAKLVTVKNTKSSKKISKLKSKTKYYVQVRTYYNSFPTKNWSKTKVVKTK